MDILGVRIDNFSKKEILKRIESFLLADKFHQIATINPEFILRAGEDEEFKNILNNCDLNVADGFGIKLAFWRYGQKLKCRLAGVDLMLEILKMADEKKLKIFLAASDRGLSNWELTRDAIHKIYPTLQINGINLNCHFERSDSEVEESNQKNIRSLDNARDDIINYDIVFCNFGAPDQEKFLNSLKLLENSKIKLAMGMGGSFDYLTGKVLRAPKFMRQIGIEWLFRLILEPKYRFKRIWKAVIIFPKKIIFNKKYV